MNWTDINELIEKSLRPVPDTRLEGLQREIHGTPGHRYVRFLFYLAQALKPKLAVELGTEWGVTSAHLCSAVKVGGGQVIGVDDTNTHPIITKRIPDWYGNFTFIKAHSLAALPQIKKMAYEAGGIGLLFQDTRDEAKLQEWGAYSPLMAQGAVWVSDDLNASDDFWNSLTAKKKLVKGLHAPDLQMGVILLP